MFKNIESAHSENKFNIKSSKIIALYHLLFPFIYCISLKSYRINMFTDQAILTSSALLSVL